jgi:DNA helicase II / ATP-dependent DNA helicase PcrA
MTHRLAEPPPVQTDPILAHLNDAQAAAVSAPTKPVLVLAGAGSGKTRVLVHRIAWLISRENVSPHSILAVTFTNKAAAEMRGRIESLLHLAGGALWIGTFHGLAHRLLRLHWREAGLPQTFQILDSDDQLRLVKKVVKALELDDTRWVPKDLQYFINAQKDEGRRPKALGDDGDPTRRTMIKVYSAYEEACKKNGVIDFAELLLRSFEILRDFPPLLEHYQKRFRHVLVDEFQDTNAIQYQWVQLLAGRDSMPFVVGDDDQSIYGWRGARVENIQRYQRDYPGTTVFRLEQNYRSTATILNAANALIAHNSGRMGKTLWTDGDRGEPIRVYAAFNERDEAAFVVERIHEWRRLGGRLQDCAILYRSNAQSRALEEAFIQTVPKIPYKIYGGQRFFERAEIKDALAYLRLLSNRNDDGSFERVVNLPTRGIGAKSLDMVREIARAHAVSMWDASTAAIKGGSLGPRGGAALLEFLTLIERIARETAGLPLHEIVDKVISASGLINHFRKEKGERGEGRIENLEELVSAARGYQPEEVEEGMSELDAFLAHAVLESGEGQAGEWEDCVQMMTLHTAKGLEFPLVFMAGLEDGLFPHQRSINDIGGLEEERRLAYVGVTRAMRRLYVTYAEQRRLHGVDQFGTPSRFIAEIPPELMEEIRPRVQVSRPVSSASSGGGGWGVRDTYGNGSGQWSSGERRGSASNPAFGRASAGSPPPRQSPAMVEPDNGTGLKLGQRVRHARFGDGVVLRIEGSDQQAQIEVNFERAGRKVLMAAYAKLSPI